MNFTEEDYLADKIADRLQYRLLDHSIKGISHCRGKTGYEAEDEYYRVYASKGTHINDLDASKFRQETFEEWKSRKEAE